MTLAEQVRNIVDDGGYTAAVFLMDDEIREEIHRKFSPCTEYEFLYIYMVEHFLKYGEVFDVS